MTIADIPIGLNTKVLHRIGYPRLVEGHVGSPESPWPYVASIGLKRSCPGPRGLQFLGTEGKVPAHGGSGGRGFGGILGRFSCSFVRAVRLYNSGNNVHLGL